LDLFSSVVYCRLVRGQCELFVKEGLDQIRLLADPIAVKKKRGLHPLARPQTPSVVERESLSLALDAVARPQMPSVVPREFGPFQFGPSFSFI
jgi:hypothetical protein